MLIHSVHAGRFSRPATNEFQDEQEPPAGPVGTLQVRLELRLGHESTAILGAAHCFSAKGIHLDASDSLLFFHPLT